MSTSTEKYLNLTGLTTFANNVAATYTRTFVSQLYTPVEGGDASLVFSTTYVAPNSSFTFSSQNMIKAVITDTTAAIDPSLSQYWSNYVYLLILRHSGTDLSTNWTVTACLYLCETDPPAGSTNAIRLKRGDIIRFPNPGYPDFWFLEWNSAGSLFLATESPATGGGGGTDIPTTTTANKVLLSSNTAGTVNWSNFSTAGILKTSNTGVISVDTNTYTKTSSATTTANKILLSTTTSGTGAWSNFSTAGLLKTSNTGVISVDTNTYLTGNQTITLSGAVTGSGTTSITTTLADSGVTAATYCGLTVNAKGIVTSAAKRYEHNIRITGNATDSASVTRYISLTLQITNAKSDAYTYSTITGSGSYSLYSLGHTSGTTVHAACGVTATSTLQGIITGVYGSTTANRLYIRYIPLVTYSSSTAYIKNNTSDETTVYLPLSSSFTFNDTKREV